MLPLSGRRALRLSVCPVCLARRSARLQPSAGSSSLDGFYRPAPATSPCPVRRGARQFASLHDPHPAPSPTSPIRQRLRLFADTELPATTAGAAALAAARLIPRDRAARLGATQNNLTRVESLSLAELTAGPDALDASGAGSGSSDDPDAYDPLPSVPGTGPASGAGAPGLAEDPDGAPESTLGRPYGAISPRAGDLLEISTDSWRVQLLAVCLGSFGGLDHFYTNTGKWFASTGVRSLFGVTRFATAAELAPVVAALPEGLVDAGADGSADTIDRLLRDDSAALNTLQDLKMGPSREAGAGLIHKMNAFAEQAAAIHIAHAAVLDNAFKVLRAAVGSAPPAPASPLASLPYTTLDQLAALLLRREGHTILGTRRHHAYTAKHTPRCPPLRNLPGTSTRGPRPDAFTAPAMYAVYRAVMADELAFRPLAAHTGSALEDVDVDGGAEKSAAHAAADHHSRSRSCFFVVSDADDIDIVRDVEAAVRRFYYDDAPGVHLHGNGASVPDAVLKRTASPLGAFLVKARATIDRSRTIRPWLPECGTVGPAVAGKEHALYPPRVAAWLPADLRILRFLHLWAGMQRFAPASRLHWVGAAVLRATGRYDAAEYLTAATGWAFLQEVGYVAPWDLPARHSMALADVPPDRTGGLAQPQDAPLLADDVFAGCRRDWGAAGAAGETAAAPTIFAIDAADAEDIDDAVSLAPCADDPATCWVHVHVADPASCIPPASPLARQAARLPQSAYLPGHAARMFAADVVRQRFSLGPGQPCLTFSARVDRASGAVRETAITPGRLGRASGHVVFITPTEVSRVVAAAEAAALRTHNVAPVPDGPAALAAGQLPWATTSFSVGTRPAQRQQQQQPPHHDEQQQQRHMTTADELTPAQRADLETLAGIATALRAARLANGAMPFYWPRPSVTVALDDTSVVAVRAPRSVKAASTMADLANNTTTEAAAAAASARAAFYDQTAYTVQSAGDPYIRISYGEDDDGDASSSSSAAAPGRRLVESLMRLAGEVAADWSHARGLAVPFRGQPDARRHDPAVLRALTRDHVYGPLAAGRRPREAALRALRRVVGADDVAAVAVPYVTMGVARYVKATSPLRRYGDLVAHWQIEGKLLEEAAGASGHSSTAAAAPLSRAQMEHDVLPLLRARERALRALDTRAGRDQWMLQALVRAWKTDGTDGADGNSRLPPTFRFTVTRVDTRRGALVGRLDWFERAAVLEMGDLNAAEAAAESPATSMAFVRLDDVQPGQVFPVALEQVDVHGNRVLVRRVGDCLS